MPNRSSNTAGNPEHQPQHAPDRVPEARGEQSRRTRSYRPVAALGVMVVALVAVLGLVALQPDGSSTDPSEAAMTETEAVLLGKGRAGVKGSTGAAQEEPGQNLGQGEASYYGRELEGNPTASGEAFNPQKMTAAHRTLPMGSRVRVTNLNNSRSVVVRINDRGPFAKRRVIDLSQEAARRLGMLSQGRAQVRLELLN